MDQNIKNRLVGVIVIFALAVIFLPMILDGSGVPREQQEIVIPPQPLVTANPEFEQKIVELQAKVDTLPDLEPRHVDEKSAADTIQRSGTDEGESSEPQVKQAAEPKAESKTETAPETKTGGDSWVLQVGSFQDRGKALAVRDKLASYRVRLGPFLNRDQTRVAQNKIKAKHDIDGIIMKYER
jgi:DedD protein